MIVKAKWLLVGCVGMSLVGGCKKLAALRGVAVDRATAAASAAAGNGAAASPEIESDGKLASKLANYIECFNRTSSDVFRTRSSYYERVNEQSGPTGKESGIWISELSSSPQCLTALDKGKKAEPALPDIDSMADAYRAEVVKLTPLLKTAHDYYDRGDFKDDKLKKGKELHPTLRAAFVDFQKVHDPFDAKVIALNDSINQRRLERLSKDPHAKLEYLIERGVADAKKLIHLAEVDSIKQLDEPAYTAALAKYEASYNEFDTYAAAHPDETKKVMMLSRYTSTGADLLKSTKELGRRKRDNKDFTKESGSPQFIEGHPAQVFKKYNDFIDSVNSLSYR